ncbi:MAG: type II secretion system major pseudopilin GspG [Verrucomicrobiae bacterium]|nr:type II secretion system major pseudopilin GspG [Verrucomicrobiae bacterium]
MKTHRNPSSLRFKRGFTLVELVIVLTIIGILSGSGIYMLIGFLDEAKYERVKGDLNTLDLAIKGYERGNYSKPPTQEQGLNALVERPTSDPQPERWRAYLEDQKALLDPWGNPYQYRYPATKSKKKYDLWSNGENGIEDSGEGEGVDDIGNW